MGYAIDPQPCDISWVVARLSLLRHASFGIMYLKNLDLLQQPQAQIDEVRLHSA